MRATQLLMEEHEIILRGLGVLHALAERAGRGEVLPRGAVDELLAFLSGFADAHHHHKEEELLFPAMERAGFRREMGPLAVMLHEHVQGRALIAAMRDAAPRLETAPDARVGFAQAAQGYLRLLSAHIQKENQVLFRMADQAIAPTSQAELDAAFAAFEAGAAANRQRFEASIVKLEAELV